MNYRSEVLESYDPLIGQSIGGRFIVEERLDEGGFGSVYLAADSQLLGRKVVVKVLLENLIEDAEARRKFDHEKEALTRLDHPGIVNIFDAGTLPDGKPFLVMPYIEGRTLTSLIKEPKPLPLSFCAKVIEDLTDALSAAHAKGILHRDVKPSNIILTEQPDGSFRTRLIDFGIARVNDSKVSPVTQVEKVQGTLWYMSPEQLQGKLDQSAAVDIFSCSAVFYEMLTGKLPFDPQSVYDMYLLHQEGVKQRVTQLRPEIPVQVDELIIQGLAFNSEDRPKDISKFGKSLASLLLAGAGKTDRQLGESLLQTVRLLNIESLSKREVNQFDEEVNNDKKVNVTFTNTNEQNSVATLSREIKKTEEQPEVTHILPKNSIPQSVIPESLSGALPQELKVLAHKKKEKDRINPRIWIWSGLAVWAFVMLVGGKIAIDFFQDKKTETDNLIALPPISRQASKPASLSGVVLPDTDSKLNNSDAALSYHLSVSKLHGKKYPEPLLTNGKEIFFKKNDEIKIVLETASIGYLYLFNETNDEKGTKQYILIHPIKNSAFIQANNSVSTDPLISDGRIGIDKIWVIWTREESVVLEKARQTGIKNRAVINDKNTVIELEKFLYDNSDSKTEVVEDSTNQQIHLKNTKDNLIHLIELENR